VVKVKVLEVDLPRQRIALSMRLADELPSAPKWPAPTSASPAAPAEPAGATGAMASAFARLKR
jgi:uncharacterized protein